MEEEKNIYTNNPAFFDTRIPGDQQAFYARYKIDAVPVAMVYRPNPNPEFYPASKDFFDTRAPYAERLREQKQKEKQAEALRELEVGLWRKDKKQEKRREEERAVSKIIKERKENRKIIQQESYQAWQQEKKIMAYNAPLGYASMPHPHSKYVKEKVLMLAETEPDVNETKEGQDRLINDLLQKTKVDKAKKESFVQYGVLSYMVKDQGEYKMFVLDHYCDKLLPQELQSKYKNKEFKAEKTQYVSPADLQRQLIEMQIAATMADNALHVCVDISSVPEAEAKTYRDQVIAGLNSENFAKENYTIICANKTQADRLSTPLLQCKYL